MAVVLVLVLGLIILQLVLWLMFCPLVPRIMRMRPYRFTLATSKISSVMT